VNTSECWEAAVYITWNPSAALPSGAASWTHQAWYSIIDGCDGDVVYSQEVNQTQAPSGAVGAFGDTWQLLGNQAFPTGWGDWFVVVSAWNPANPNDSGDGLPMQVCTALVVPVGPTVSVRALVQGSQPAVTPVNQSDYTAWQQSWQPVQIPVEGHGDRTEFQLQAAVDQLYSDQTNWQASLEDAPGLDFWTSPTGGTPLTAAEFNGLIASGSYSGDVWVSQDQADAGSPTSPVRFDFQETAGPGYASALVSTVVEKQYHVVISDFGPYPHVANNTSQTVASATKNALKKLIKGYNNLHSTFGQLNVKVDILGPIAVAWGAPANAIASETSNPASPVDFWLALGENTKLAPGGFVVETRANNFEDPRLRDVLLQPGNGTGGLPYTVVQLPPKNAAVNAFLQGAPTSTTPGNYVCDEMAFDLYSAIGKGVNAGAFVHVSGSGNLNAIGEALAWGLWSALMVEKANAQSGK
jgi:hypothetical protein